jgi:hypothetical protein
MLAGVIKHCRTNADDEDIPPENRHDEDGFSD